MEKYLVTLQAQEIEQLRALVAKGRHSAHKVINALLLLNCDKSKTHQGRWTNLDIAQLLQMSEWVRHCSGRKPYTVWTDFS